MAKKSNFQVALEDFEYKVFNYSGRGMYGKQCLAVNLAGNEVMFLCADMLEYVVDNPEVVEFGALEFSDAIRSMKTDNLGMGSVIYFPEIEFVDDESAEEESVEPVGENCCQNCQRSLADGGSPDPSLCGACFVHS